MYPPKPVMIREGDSLHQEAVDSPLWVAEPKLDGHRTIYRDGRLWTRNKRPLGSSFKTAAILSGLAAIPDGVVLDGELMQPYSSRPVYHIFDIPTVRGALESRRLILERLPVCYPVKIMRRIDKVTAIEHALHRGWEGVVYKRIDSVYRWQSSSLDCQVHSWRKIRL